MKLKIIGDKINNYDGKLRAEFYDKDEKHVLCYDVEDWQNASASGFIGGSYIQITTPIPMTLKFDELYELDKDYMRKVYQVLTRKGWKPLQKENKTNNGI